MRETTILRGVCFGPQVHVTGQRKICWLLNVIAAAVVYEHQRQ
jgi:hypothetical protein